jgi:hypothetical protein
VQEVPLFNSIGASSRSVHLPERVDRVVKIAPGGRGCLVVVEQAVGVGD